jgi:hypothetical protein
MAHTRSAGRGPVVAELLLLHRLPPVARGAVALVVAVACVVAGVTSLAVQHHFAAQPGGGRLAALLAAGSTPATAWEGWAAAIFFLVALRRLRSGATEPPAGRTPVEQLTLAQMRAGLVREYTMVRAGLVVLCIVATIDASRAARYAVAAAAADPLARGSLAATVIEAAGVVAATVVLALWAGSFREQLERIGALAGTAAAGR